MKAKNPFLGLDARGKYGDIAVGSLTRGIQVVKKKTDPFNPKTNAQKSVREIYGEGVEAFKQLELTYRDRGALTRGARLFKLRRNAWQMYFQLYARARQDFLTFPFVHAVRTNTTPAGFLHITCKFPSGLSLRVGLTHKFNQNFQWYTINELGASGNYQIHIPNLVAGQQYFFTFVKLTTPYTPPWWQKITLYQDNFNDGNFNGWTVVAGVWTAVPLYLKGTGDFGRIYTDVNMPVGEKEWLFKIKNHGTGALSGNCALFVLRIDDNDFLAVIMSTLGAPPNCNVTLVEKTPGVWNNLFVSTKYNYFADAGTWFWVKVKKVGGNVYFKIWKDGESEPSGWDWSGAHNPALIDAGHLGGWSQRVDANGMGLDDIEVYRMVYHPAIPERTDVASGMYEETIKMP